MSNIHEQFNFIKICIYRIIEVMFDFFLILVRINKF